MSQCLVCEGELFSRAVEPGLMGQCCDRCEGAWLPWSKLLEWGDGQAGSVSPSGPEWTEGDLAVTGELEQHGILRCPDCHSLMRRYRVSHLLPFFLDRCGSCQGVWFDRHEWNVIRASGLGLHVQDFFTDAWQARERQAESRLRFEKRYLEQFGEQDYTRIRELRAWLKSHPQRARLLAYLTDPDPYHG